MNNTKSNEKATDAIYDLGYYNSNGIINHTKLKSHLMVLFMWSYTFLLFGCYGVIYYDVPALNSVEAWQDIGMDFYMFHYTFFTTYFTTNEIIPIDSMYLMALWVCLVPPLVIYALLYKRVIANSKFQAALSSVGLSQYYFHKRAGQNIYLKFKKGTKNQYQSFLNQLENLSQILNVENLRVKRYGENGVVLQYSHGFPTIDDLKGYKVSNFLKQNHLFLGIGLPNVGEVFDKKELLHNKFLARYMRLEDIPQGVANLGSAGGGKSNTMNQYLYSLFYNFEWVHYLYLVDFKGGIEAEPIKDLEARFKSGKIDILDDNRIGLYCVLKRLYVINKARMQYLKAHKMKKMSAHYIVLIFDELAEILDYAPSNKEERSLQEKIAFYLESLLRTCRSQGFKIFYSTQSYLSTSSGLSSGMKNNTKLKITHQLGSNLQVGTIKPIEELAELGIFPTKYDVGKNVVINEANNDIYEVRSLYVPDDFIEDIVLKPSDAHILFEEELKPFYIQAIDELKKSAKEEDAYYSIYELANDLGVEEHFQAPITSCIIESQPKESVAPTPTNHLSDLASKMRSKKALINEDKTEEIDSFISSL
ncbi:hypothetical protein [Sulfurospirillum cavolei]|uniref:hypothetical protein n=1 Tax=Sulfurospirillum cavolei TaxID=366522 RepID=UPI0005AACCB7|nr:hypothetical protein [Sulfurospirillum cavolei]